MNFSASEQLAVEYESALLQCRNLYRSAAQVCIERFPTWIPNSHQEFVEHLDELHRALISKIYVFMVEGDRVWSAGERLLGRVLMVHLHGEAMDGPQLASEMRGLSDQVSNWTWYTLIRPFDQIPALRERIAELETCVVRQANIVAKVDGAVSPEEIQRLHSLQQAIQMHLRPLRIEERKGQVIPPPFAAASSQAYELSPTEEPLGVNYEQRPNRTLMSVSKDVSSLSPSPISNSGLGASINAPPLLDMPSSQEERLAEAMKQLDGLIGLTGIKHEIQTLSNFLRVQKQRENAGLPKTAMSLHMVFSGNPGTGKTTVARIVGQILAAMGILTKGHLVETDRSGLVAEYAGQTAPKVNKLIDGALDGVLFIDEAYNLVNDSGDDAYGKEALATLLKRMEDHRDRLIVILAGYPDSMRDLLEANPGLSSRFNTHLHFDDYSASELGQIFGVMCDANHYNVSGPTQAKLLMGFAAMHRERDERFGNGRLVRNTFESAIRRLANRVASVAPITRDMLTTIKADDIKFDKETEAELQGESLDQQRFVVACKGCKKPSRVRGEYLGKKVECRRCNQQFLAEWGEPILDAKPAKEEE